MWRAHCPRSLDGRRRRSLSLLRRFGFNFLLGRRRRRLSQLRRLGLTFLQRFHFGTKLLDLCRLRANKRLQSLQLLRRLRVGRSGDDASKRKLKSSEHQLARVDFQDILRELVLALRVLAEQCLVRIAPSECRVHVVFASDLACAIVLMLSGGVHFRSTFAANSSLKIDISCRAQIEIERSRVGANAVQPSLSVESG